MPGGTKKYPGPAQAAGLNASMLNFPDARPEISEDVISERLGEEVVLLNLKTNRFFALNKTGSRLWELLSRGESLSAIQEQLCSEFEVDPMELRTDVERMLVSMGDEQLVRFRKD